MKNLAVMANRVAEDPDDPMKGLDDFPTPPWAGWALCETMGVGGSQQICLEPAANRGYLMKGLQPYFKHVVGRDVWDYGDPDIGMRDFLEGPVDEVGYYDWIITNPPFKKGLEFYLRALAMKPRVGIAMFLRTQWIEGGERYKKLFSQYDVHVCPFVERVALVKGRFDPDASTATSYSWFVVKNGLDKGTTWIKPGFKKKWMEAQ